MENKNTLICDPKDGICEISSGNDSIIDSSYLDLVKEAVKIVYFTDPICSSCWGIEPQLRKLKLEYGSFFEIEYHMGGLLPDWSYNSGGISKPSDVAHHWDEVSIYYDMPIDGDIWLEDPLHSSYPPSIAFKAAQMQSEDKAILLLREIRELVFTQKKNITQWKYIESAARKVGLDVERLKKDYDSSARTLFEEDLKLGRELKVRGFPTLFFSDGRGNSEMVYGSKSYESLVESLLKVSPTAVKTNYDRSWGLLFSKYNSLTAREYSELTGIPRSQVEVELDSLCSQNKLKKVTIKNGSIWILNEPQK